MHYYTISSIFILILTLITTQITAEEYKCLSYNTLSLPVIYHDICVTGSCMNATTFIADFDIPINSNNYPQDGYRNSPRMRNGYNQDFCAAISTTSGDLSLRPTGCNSIGCTDTPACGFRAIDGFTRGLVEPELGADGYPRWRNNKNDPGAKKSIASPTTFNKWYYDSSATIRIESELNLTRKGHTQTFQFQSERFFPIDGRGFWDLNDKQKDLDQKDRNFGFTTAIISEFVYTGGENFTFRGDDDVWVFIDKKLAIDIGGLHPAQCRAIILDEVANGGVGNVYTCNTVDSIVNANNARAGETYTIPGLTHGSRHTLSIFHAERHEEGSSFAMSTSIGFNTGDIGGGGLDYNLPSATGARIYIGTYQFITFGQVDSAPEPIQLPVYTATPSDTPITIILEFPPVAPTQIACRILQLSSTVAASLRLNEVDRNTIRPPLDVTFVKNASNQATWASVTAEHDHVTTTCQANPQDQPSWTITVRTTGAGSGYLYCIAVDVPGEVYSDYTAEGRVRDRDFYRQWVATTISSQQPPSTLPPTTEAPTTTEPPTTASPTTATEAPMSTTQPPTTVAPTDNTTTTTQPPTTLTPTNATTPTTATATPTHDAATTTPPTPTESPSTQPPTPTVTPAPTTTPAPTNAGTTASPTSTPTPTPTPTNAGTTAPPTPTSTPTSAVTTAPPTPTSTSAPTVTDAPTSPSPSTPTTPTTSIPTSTTSPTPAPTNIPPSTPTPTSNSSSTGVPVSSVVSSSDTSTIAQLQIIVPVAVAGVIVLIALVWGSIICWKRRRNGVFRTHGHHMEMV